MTPPLSTADLGRLEAAFKVLLSPLDHPDLDSWRAAVSRSLKSLLGADKAIFGLPLEGAAPMYSEDYCLTDLRAYPGRMQPIAQRVSMWERAVQLGTFDRSMLWDGRLDEYYGSEYYNDYIVPLQGFDMIGAALPLGGEPTVRTVAQLVFHHEREDGPRFGDRGLALLRLIYPAWRAGMEIQIRHAAQRDQIARIMDSLTEGLQLHDRTGRVLHRNAALERLLTTDPKAELLRTEIDRTAGALTSLFLDGTEASGSTPSGPVACDVWTGRTRYRLRGSIIAGELFETNGCVLVSLERLTPEPPSEEFLREHWGLSGKEARVALLMVSGKSDAEIANLLFISHHTARHHSEQVRQKLGVHSRAEVGPKLLGS